MRTTRSWSNEPEILGRRFRRCFGSFGSRGSRPYALCREMLGTVDVPGVPGWLRRPKGHFTGRHAVESLTRSEMLGTLVNGRPKPPALVPVRRVDPQALVDLDSEKRRGPNTFFAHAD